MKLNKTSCLIAEKIIHVRAKNACPKHREHALSPATEQFGFHFLHDTYNHLFISEIN